MQNIHFNLLEIIFNFICSFCSNNIFVIILKEHDVSKLKTVKKKICRFCLGLTKPSMFSPLLCCWSPGSRSWCWTCVPSGSRADVWRGWVALGLGRCPARPASGRPAASTSPSPRSPEPPPAGPGTVPVQNNMREERDHNLWQASVYKRPAAAGTLPYSLSSAGPQQPHKDRLEEVISVYSQSLEHRYPTWTWTWTVRMCWERLKSVGSAAMMRSRSSQHN